MLGPKIENIIQPGPGFFRPDRDVYLHTCRLYPTEARLCFILARMKLPTSLQAAPTDVSSAQSA